MKMQRIAIALTMINLIIMTVQLTKMNTATGRQHEQNKLEVLRGSGLEIIDSTGKIRASISFHKPVEKDGITYPAGILLRLISSKGQPNVKIDASEDGGGLSFSNEANGYIQLHSKESGSFLKIRNADGKETIVKP